MTVVVGIRGKRGVLLAGDSQFSTPWSNRKMVDSKVFALSPVLAAAYCGSARLGNILTYHLDALDDPPLGRDEHRWTVREFIPFLREVASEHGHLHVRHEVDHLGSSAFLLAVRGRLFIVDDDLQVSEHALPYDALGSGEDVAIGALRAALGDDPNPRPDARLERVATAAVEAAAKFTNHVGGAVNVIRTELYTDEERGIARRIIGRRRG